MKCIYFLFILILATMLLLPLSPVAERVEAGDGISFLYQPDTSSEITVLRFMINGGKKAVSPGQRGLAFMTTRLCTEAPSNNDIRELMNLGSTFQVLAEGDFTAITLQCLSENLDPSLKLLARIIEKPLFSQLRIGHVKEIIESRQDSEDDNTVQMVLRESFNALFGGTGYGGSPMGTEETLKSIKKKDIDSYYNRFFNLSNMVITVSSDLPVEELGKIIKNRLAKLPRGEKRETLTPVESPKITKKELVVEKDTKQAMVALTFPLPGLTPKNFACAYLLQNHLGEGIGSLIWPLRAEKHLAYHVEAKLTPMKDAGILTIFLKTDNSKKELACRELNTIVTKLFQGGISARDLETAKLRSRTHFLKINETKENRTYYLGFFELLGPGYKLVEDFDREIGQVTVEEINAYIKEVLPPGRGVKILIGPKD